MTITTYRGEKNIDLLAKRIFGDGLKDHPEWKDQLLRENPQLADIKSVTTGTPIVVPVDAVPIADEDPSGQLANNRLLDALDVLEVKETAKLAAREAALNQTATLAASPELTAAAGKDPALAGRIAEIAADAKLSLTQVAKDRKALQETLASARAAAAAAPPPSPPRRRPVGKVAANGTP